VRESRKQKAESRKQKAESRKQKAESRKQKAESRKQKAGDSIRELFSMYTDNLPSAVVVNYQLSTAVYPYLSLPEQLF